ncbi:OmpA family protein [uncultured Croceitalea sp.]|uniref:OmpA family protein n=1 Tax=uncultured Croceitalea sp. TaxID=1798908 RepID=UPI00374F4D27
MKKLKYIPTLLILFSVFVSYAQRNGKVKRAKTDYEAFAYQDAIDTYKDMVEAGYTGQEIFQNLGNANYLNANYEEAAKWYKQLFAMDSVQIESNYYFRYAQSLKSLKEYEESHQWMERFIKKSKVDGRASKFTNNRDYLDDIKRRSGRYEILLADINSKSSDFAPSFYGNQLIFSSARDTGIATRRIHEWNDTPFLNLFSGAIDENGNASNAKRFSKKLNAKTHESSTVFTKDGKTVYFTRNNSDNGRRFTRDDKGVSRLKIFRADLVEGEWKNIIELPFNGDDYSTAHPTLDRDEKRMFFASDRPGTFGASDIWIVDLFDDGNFGTPVNLGPEINTEGRETFPFVTDNNILYFASDGHPGLGGLDVFATEIVPNRPKEVLNLGEPVNSDEDDFSFIIDMETKRGYFASNRPNGLGSDDIYSFKETKPLVFKCITNIAGVVRNSEDDSLLADTSVEIFAPNGDVITSTKSNEKGKFSTSFECNGNTYTIIGTKRGFNDSKIQFKNNGAKENMNLKLSLKPEEKLAKKGTDLTKLLNLKPIYFDLDKSEIRPDAIVELEKVRDYMRQFPKSKITIKSHTDSRGNDNYNLSLSKRRAEATLNYLVNKGVKLNRLKAKGYGETRLLNRCTNGVDCSNEEHNLNRRSEFIVIN